MLLEHPWKLRVGFGLLAFQLVSMTVGLWWVPALLILLAVLVLFMVDLLRSGKVDMHVFEDVGHTHGYFLYKSILAKLLLPKRFKAITIGNFIFVTAESVTKQTKIHELRHVVQFNEYGFFKFLWVYFQENRKTGYKCNRFEEEARKFAGQSTRCS